YLFVFLRRFETRSLLFKFIGIHVWVYAMMLPVSLAIFGTFSRLHPLSIVWTMLFILFYPLALLLHLFGKGGLLDGPMRALLQLPAVPVNLEAGYSLLAAWIVLSILVLPSKTVERLLPYLAAAVFVGAVYQVA
ncbi:MAG: ComEC/Rec2 family competence protein, partial [Campylobacterales bacterium]